ALPIFVAGDQQQRLAVCLGGTGHMPGKGAGGNRGAPPGAELAGTRQRRRGVGDVMRHEAADFSSVATGAEERAVSTGDGEAGPFSHVARLPALLPVFQLPSSSTIRTSPGAAAG